MLGYPARYIRETIALAPGLPIAIRFKLNTDGKRSNPRWRRTDIPNGHFKFPHLWPVKFPQAGRVDYQSSSLLRARRAAASLSL